MHMNIRNSVTIFVGALALVFASSCAKTNYDGSTRAQPFVNQMQAPPQPQAPAVSREVPQPTVTGLPVLSFVQSEVNMDDDLVARLEVQISQPSTLPVTAVVRLENGSAIHYVDFSGFKLPSPIKYSMNEAETSQTIVIPPGQTRVALPDIGGMNGAKCNGIFFAKLNPNNVQNAQVNDDTSKIMIPCVRRAPPAQRMPQPGFQPQPPQPGQTAPCPPQAIQAFVNARFENAVIKTNEHARRAEVEIQIDQKSTLPVTIDVETQNATATAEQDFHPVKMQVTIPPGKLSVSFVVDLKSAHHCSEGQSGDEARFEFKVIATAITNANMQMPQAIVSVKKDVGHCK